MRIVDGNFRLKIDFNVNEVNLLCSMCMDSIISTLGRYIPRQYMVRRLDGEEVFEHFKAENETELAILDFLLGLSGRCHFDDAELLLRINVRIQELNEQQKKEDEENNDPKEVPA